MSRSSTLSLLILMAGCTGETSDKDDPIVDPDCAGVDLSDYEPAYTLVRDADPLGMMMSVWGPCDDDVWVVGGQKRGAGFVLRGSGETFTEVPVPEGTLMLDWVHGTSSEDVWVGGVNGALLHWDGEAWEDFSIADMEGAIWGLYAVSETDALVVAGSFFNAGSPQVYRWDGTALTEVPLPDDIPADGTLFKVTHDGSQYLVVGSRGLALAVDDDGAVQVPVSDAGPTDDLVTVYARPGGTPVAVGGTTGGKIWTYQDRTTGWTLLGESFSKLNGVHDMGYGRIVAVGDRGSHGTWIDGTGWNESLALFTTDLLHATWVAPNGDAYAVGGNFLTSGDTFRGVLAFSPGP